MISNILGGTVLATYSLSTLITVLNVSSSNNRIRRKGKIIKSITTNSLAENIKYFIKDYGFLFLPIFNIIKSIKNTIMKDATYDSNRLSVLEDRDRIEDSKKQETVVTNADTTKTIEVNKPAQNTTPAKNIVIKKEKTLEEMDCFEKKEYYRKEYDRLVSFHKKSKAEGKSVTYLNGINSKIKEVVLNYKKCEKECTLEELKNERNNTLSNNFQRKLK